MTLSYHSRPVSSRAVASARRAGQRRGGVNEVNLRQFYPMRDDGSGTQKIFILHPPFRFPYPRRHPLSPTVSRLRYRGPVTRRGEDRSTGRTSSSTVDDQAHPTRHIGWRDPLVLSDMGSRPVSTSKMVSSVLLAPTWLVPLSLVSVGLSTVQTFLSPLTLSKSLFVLQNWTSDDRRTPVLPVKFLSVTSGGWSFPLKS